MRNSYQLISRIALAAVGILFGLLIAEGCLLLLGFGRGPQPHSSAPDTFAFIAPYQGHKLAGWQLTPGTYQLLLGGRDHKTTVTVLDDGSRTTRRDTTNGQQQKRTILFLGDSFIFGEGLSDEETLPWKLQDIVPASSVKNFGVGGYGTCQAMFRLEELKQTIRSGDVVIYGLSSFHEERNTADPRQDFWIALQSPQRTSQYPRCRLQNNQIVREEPRRWNPIFPLTGISRITKLLTDAWLRVQARSNIRDQRKLTFALLHRMKTIAAERNASFVVLFQEISPSALKTYQQFLIKQKIRFIDGSAIIRKRELLLPDRHPGPKITEFWADQIAQELPTISEVTDIGIPELNLNR